MAHIKTGTTTKGNRDSISKRLGVKVYGGSTAENGSIIVRQRGTTFHAGAGTRAGKDFTIYAVKNGTVQFVTRHDRTFIEIR